MALKDWKKIKAYDFGLEWQNQKNILTYNVKMTQHFRNGKLIWEVILPENIQTKTGLMLWKKQFITQGTALKFAKSYMRTH